MLAPLSAQTFVTLRCKTTGSSNKRLVARPARAARRAANIGSINVPGYPRHHCDSRVENSRSTRQSTLASVTAKSSGSLQISSVAPAGGSLTSRNQRTERSASLPCCARRYRPPRRRMACQIEHLAPHQNRELIFRRPRSRRAYAEGHSPGAQAWDSSPAARLSSRTHCRSSRADHRCTRTSPHRAPTLYIEPKEWLLAVGILWDSRLHQRARSRESRKATCAGQQSELGKGSRSQRRLVSSGHLIGTTRCPIALCRTSA